MPHRYKDGNGLDRICGDVDSKASQHYPQRFGQAVTECFLHNYPEVVETVQKTKDKLESNRPKKEAKDHGCKTVRRNIGKIFTVYWFIGLSVLVYRFIGVLVIVVYRFIGLSWVLVIGMGVTRNNPAKDPGFVKLADLRQVIRELAA